jgi:hypothetical protein
MVARYEIGQKVIIKAAHSKRLSPRDSGLGQYTGQSGEVTDYYWMSPPAGEVFYVYTVRVEDGNKEIVLHEDEIEAF